MPPTLLALALFAAPVLVFVVLLWRRELVMALPFIVILNGLPLSVGATHLRIDQFSACLLVVPLAVAILSGKRRLRMDATAWWLVALLVSNLMASALNSPARTYSFSQCANLASAWLIHLLLINYLDTREDVAEFLEQCLRGALVASSIGIVAFLLAVAGLPVGGAEVSASAVQHLTRPYGAYGTMVEPNIFGSFMGAFVALAVAILAVARPASATPSSRLLRWTAALSAVGLVLSFTRSAWIGTIVALAFVALMGRRWLRVRTRYLLMPPLVGLAIVLALLLLPGSAGTFLRFKLGNLVNFGSETAVLRLMTYSLALEQTLRHPLIGLGTFSFAPLLAEGTDFARFDGWRGLWIGNYLLLALHDTGVIGLGLWLGLLWSIVARGLRASRIASESDPALAAQALALTGAVVSLLVAFLATTGFSLGYPWLLIGLLGAHARLAIEGRSIPIASPREPGLIPSPADAI